ncbi:MAG: glycosyltransferase family 39 protein [Bacteroidales bacterium]|nr:glycosyltransferase family 39 protein [Bacteroidales bacterium]
MINTGKKSWIKSKWFSGLVFSLLFAGLCWFYNYNETFVQSPQSVHIWRQTNGLSITQMYYLHNLNFFHPEIQNQIGDGGISGKSAGEFPVIYFAVAKIWQFLGKSEWSFRLFQLLILFSGIFLLFLMLIPITGNAIRAGFISMLVFTSPMFIFYGPNFLPDGPALAFIFIAWFFFYQFYKKRKNLSLWISAAFFFLAITIKITSATSFIALGMWCVIENLFIKDEKRVFNFRLKHYIPFIFSILLIVFWNYYVNYYNDLHKADYSFRGIWPIWDITKAKFYHVINMVDKIYFREFFSPLLQYTTMLVWIFMLFKINKITPFFGFLLIVMPIGFAVILALWFQVLEGHDYYLITQIQVLVIVWAIFFSYLKEKKLWSHPIVYVLLLVVFALLANDGMRRNKSRYAGWMNEGYKMHMEALTKIESNFKEWNIKPDDKVISIPDLSINASLYYMNRKGYTDFGSDFSEEEIFRLRISQGAKYLVINDTTILGRPLIRKFAGDFVGRYRNIEVFKLKNMSY